MPFCTFRLKLMLASVAAGVACCASWAAAGTIRDDVNPQQYVALGASPAYSAVGELDVDVFLDGQPAVGSATLIAPNWVLTAAHVVEAGHGVRFLIGGQTYTASRWVANQKYDGNLIRGYDIALVQLSQPVTNIAAAQIYRGHREFGLTGTFVGVGRTGTGLTGDTTDDRIKRAGTNVIDGTLRRDSKDRLQLLQKVKRSSRTFAVDFDQPGNPATNHFGSATPTALEYLISRGDSGGPVFIDDPTDSIGEVVAGIHSFGEILDERDDSSYGDMTGHTRVSAFAKWIDKVTTSERYQRKLHFITPTEPNLTTGEFFPTSARAIGPVMAVATVPEPGTRSAAAIMLLGMCLLRRRRKFV